MASGYGLTIGLNSIDPAHYGSNGLLVACENDALSMKALLEKEGFKVDTLLTQDATVANVKKAIRDLADKAKPGDIVVITYSGHGGQLPDLNGDEDDNLDETWCLYDRQWVDDELYTALCAFKPGVRVLFFSDSCHSGSVVKAYRELVADPCTRALLGAGAAAAEENPVRVLPMDVVSKTYYAHRDLYDPILKKGKARSTRTLVKASVLLISGCQDNQLSLDGPFNGLFTATLLRVWNGGKFKKDYRHFFKHIRQLMPPTQSPNYFWAEDPNPAFEKQRPFTINAKATTAKAKKPERVHTMAKV